MKVLTAGRGDRDTDFAYTIEGELVIPADVCFADEHGPGDCGCGRAFAGASSDRATTIAIVAELEMDLTDLAEAFDLDEQTAADLADLAAEFDVGTRLRRDIHREDEVYAE